MFARLWNFYAAKCEDRAHPIEGGHGKLMKNDYCRVREVWFQKSLGMELRKWDFVTQHDTTHLG